MKILITYSCQDIVPDPKPLMENTEAAIEEAGETGSIESDPDVAGPKIPDSVKREEERQQCRNYLEACKYGYHICLKICTPRMRTDLEGSTGFAAMQEAQDLVSLLKLTEGIC